jgi:hypothetical protein
MWPSGEQMEYFCEMSNQPLWQFFRQKMAKIIDGKSFILFLFSKLGNQQLCHLEQLPALGVQVIYRGLDLLVKNLDAMHNRVVVWACMSSPRR